MRVFVLCEDPSEGGEVKNFAEVLTSMSPMLASDAHVDDKGNVTINHGKGASMRRVRVDAVTPQELFDHLTGIMLGVVKHA